MHAWLGVPHGFHDTQAGQLRGLADDGDLACALDGAQPIEDRIEVPEVGLLRRGLQMREESLFPRRASIPRVGLRRVRQRDRVMRRGAAEHLWAEARVDRPPIVRDGFQGGGEHRARLHVVDANRSRRIRSRHQPGTEHPIDLPAPSLVVWHQEHRGALRTAVQDRQRAWLDHPRQVEKLVALPERLLAGPFCRALQHGDTVTDGVEHPRAPRRELFRWKHFRAGEHRLSEEDERRNASPAGV